MALSRRLFLARSLVVGPVAMSFWLESRGAAARGTLECNLPLNAEPRQFVPDERVVHLRVSAAELLDPARADELRRFRAAVAVVRGLDPTDVIGWIGQVAQHCGKCALTDQHNVHYDHQFLPWHRAYLYFLERIFRTVGGDDALRLPYWDWETAASRTLPEIYAPPDQPLYWPNRQLTGPAWPLSNEDVDVQPLLSIPDAEILFGTTVQRQPVPAAYSGPHAHVHNAFDPGDMADLQYSPRDPVFYAHHANVDRMWSSWVAAGHDTPDFGDAKVYFYDETRQWRYVLMNDLRDERRLGYEYSSLMRGNRGGGHALRLTRTENGITLSPDQARALAAMTGPQYLVITNIQNLDTLSADAFRYGIFIGTPPVGVVAASFPGFLGKIARVRSSAHDHPGPLTAALTVTGKLAALVGGDVAALDLTVAPLDEWSRTTAPAIPLVADSITLID